MGLRSYIAKRIAYSFILLLLVLSLNYIIFMLMPGDPAAMLVAPIIQKEPDPEKAARLKQQLNELWGIADPPQIRFIKYIKNMLTWNFGVTFRNRLPVADEMIRRIPFTLVLLGGSTTLAIIIGVILGALSAHRRGGKFDTFCVTSSLIFYSLPTFWMGLLFILIFYVQLGWFPNAHPYPAEWILPQNAPKPFTITTASYNPLGMVVNVDGGELLKLIVGYARHAFLPVTVLTLFQYGGFLLITRATMIEALTEDYIVTARAKGVSETNVIFKHALPNASLPIITSAALSYGFILSGAIITEGVFSWPGLGGWIFDAIGFKDYNILQAVFYVIALCVIAANFIADLLYGIIDPRIKYD